MRKRLLLGIATIGLAGCATSNPIQALEYVMPCPAPPLTEALDIPVKQWKGWTTVGLTKATITLEQKKLGFYSDLALPYVNKVSAGYVALAGMMLGVGGGSDLGFLNGARKKRPEDYSKEEYERALASEPVQI